MSQDQMSIYQYLGGDAGVRSLVFRFYDIMDTRVEAKTLRMMHPPDLQESKEKFFDFLSGWFGGPQRFVEKYGHPRLRMRHLPFAIDKKARDEWMLCMRIALAEHIPNTDVRKQIEEVFARMATHMQNQQENIDIRTKPHQSNKN